MVTQMRKTAYGELLFDEEDLFDFAMKGHTIWQWNDVLVENLNLVQTNEAILDRTAIASWQQQTANDLSVNDWHQLQQQQWHMPAQYKNTDIASHVLSLCHSQSQLQRCGQELLLYQERNLFDLLRYLRYLVDVMKQNNVIWGLGRGSSVSSYVLYLLEVHRIDSMYYDLDIHEFLR